MNQGADEEGNIRLHSVPANVLLNICHSGYVTVEEEEEEANNSFDSQIANGKLFINIA